jgi:GTP-binding protein HflX
MNNLTLAGVFVEDKLFATLDPTVRRLKLPSGREILIADTVGFIRRLPHELIESFRSTFEEVSFSQLLLNIVDGSDPEANSQSEVVEGVLRDMDLATKPIITVVNKCDAEESHYTRDDGAVRISALRGDGLEALLQKVDDTLRAEFRRCVLKIPFKKGEILANLYKLGFVWKVVYEEDGILVDCELERKHFNKYLGYEIAENG